MGFKPLRPAISPAKAKVWAYFQEQKYRMFVSEKVIVWIGMIFSLFPNLCFRYFVPNLFFFSSVMYGNFYMYVYK